MKIYAWIRDTVVGRTISIFLCALMLQIGAPISAFSAPVVYVTNKDTAEDLKSFIEDCNLEERVQLLQSLNGFGDIRDEWFGVLKGLPELDNFTTDKKKASAQLPLKPKTFNEVLPVTVIDAIEKEFIDGDVLSNENIRKELVWRRYNKINYWLHDHDNINYHEDIVQWVAEKKGVPESKIKAFSTYYLEHEICMMYFAEIWEKLSPGQKNELLSKIEAETNSVINNKTAIVAMSTAGAIGALGATVAFTGFAFYTTMSVVIGTVAAWFGATLPFAAYMAASSTVSVLGGPVGWVIGGVMFVGGAFVLGWREVDTVARFVMTVNAIKAKHLGR